MKSVKKMLGLLLLGALSLTLIAVFVLTQVLDPNDYKDEIRQLVRDKTQLELQLNGDIGWSLFPWLGLELTDVDLAQSSSPDQPFAQVRLLGFSVRVLPLLRKQVHMSDIRIDSLNLNLIRAADGQGNWEQQTLTPAQLEHAASARAAAQEGNGLPVIPQLQLDIDSLIINSARLDYHDLHSAERFTLENVQISTGSIGEQRDIPVKISGFLANSAPLLRARLELSAAAYFDTQQQLYQLNSLKLVGEIAGEPLNNKAANVSLSGNLHADLSQQTAHWQQLKFSVNQLKGLGDLQINQLNTQPQLQGRVSIAALNLKEFLPGIGVQLPKTANSNALSHFELDSPFTGSLHNLRLTDAVITLDDSRLTGQLGIHSQQHPALAAQLAVDRLNLDDYLPPQTVKKSASATASNQAGSGNTPMPDTPTRNPWSNAPLLPLQALKSLSLDTRLKAGRLTVHAIPFESAQLAFSAQQGDLKLESLQARLYGGDLQASATFKADTAQPLISLTTTLQGIPIDRLMHALQQETALTGTLDLNGSLSTQGNSEHAWVEHLKGRLRFNLLDGAMPSANLEQQLCLAIASLNRKPLTQPFTRQHTAFSAFKGSAQITNGRANNPDLHIETPGLRIDGAGAVDLNVLGMDYALGITLLGDTRAMPDPACAINPRFVGVAWPVTCRGPLEAGGQNCRVDQRRLKAVIATLAGEKINQKIQDKLGDKVSPELQDALKGLFKR